MAKKVKETIQAKGVNISIHTEDFKDEFLSLTDIAKYKNAEFSSDVIKNWMRNRSTVEYLGLWERLHNENFNSVEFDRIESEAGKNAFVLTPTKWIETVNAIGMVSTRGRYAATFAHKDIALKFASWISAELELYIIKDYQRLKNDESSKFSLNWNLNRELAKINYKLHTDAVKKHIVPTLTSKQLSFVYANEADVLNVAMFGMTAKEWRENNSELSGNMRDHANLHQLLVLANIESYNSILISQEIAQPERLKMLNELAKQQLQAMYQLDSKNLSRIGHA